MDMANACGRRDDIAFAHVAKVGKYCVCLGEGFLLIWVFEKLQFRCYIVSD
jgi:hypothetical protein